MAKGKNSKPKGAGVKATGLKGSKVNIGLGKTNLPNFNLIGTSLNGYLPNQDEAQNPDQGLTTNISSNGAYGNLAQGYIGDLKGNYDSQYGQYLDNYKQTKATTNASRDRIANNAYQAYMRAKKAQNDLASNYGMTGGAKEGLSVSNIGSYNTNMANNESGRGQDLQNAKNTFDTNVANAKMSYNNAAQQAQYQAQQQDLQRQDQINATNYNAWVQYVPGSYKTKKAVTKAISKLDKSDPYYAQKKEVLQAVKAGLKK